jgi:hypothetical protein
MLVESGVISRTWNARVSHVKVAALRLFHPNVSSVLFGPSFYYCDTVSWGERDRGHEEGIGLILRFSFVKFS